MPSPFHQKYATQTHKVFEDYLPSVPDPTKSETSKMDTDRRSSAASASSTSSTGSLDSRRGSASERFEHFKRSDDPEKAARRASLHDSYGKPGFFGSMWHSWTRGPAVPSGPAQSRASDNARDVSTLRSE